MSEYAITVHLCPSCVLGFRRESSGEKVWREVGIPTIPIQVEYKWEEREVVEENRMCVRACAHVRACVNIY